MQLEHRRHSIRDHSNPHLSKKGILLANQVGRSLGQFDYIFSSISTRAVETTVAMGYSITATIDFGQVSKNIEVKNDNLSFPSTFHEYSIAYNEKRYIYHYCKNLVTLFMETLQSLEDNAKVLVISHGGIIEASTIGFLPTFDFNTWGKEVAQCEGVQLTYNGNNFLDGKILRV